MTILDAVAVLIAVPPTLLLAIFSAEVLTGLRPLAATADKEEVSETIVLIPAHDEAAGIAATINALRRQIDPRVGLLVVADNCTDDTADRARRAGAKAIERNDPSRRGKGYALAFGRDHLATAPPACVVVLDADCVVGGRGIAALARAALAADRPVQARYLQRPDPTASPTAQISNFAFLVKNLVRQRGMQRLGGVAALTGTGMAFPWKQFAMAPLANAELAEDLALGTWLTLAGHPPALDETVHIWGKAETGQSLLVQRTRWERGFMSVARRQALPLLMGGLIHGSRSRSWLGLHLIVPPLALLFTAACVALVPVAALTWAGASMAAIVMLGGALLAAGAATIAAWHAEGRDWIDGRSLVRIPLYVAGKLPLYRALLRRRGEQGWVRTRRTPESDASADELR